jgi:penicillin V acylase-like amidase (Ntn superfamily)
MCTRVLWNTNKLAVIAGRTMDWPESTEPIITVFPRGMHRDGGMLGTQHRMIEGGHMWTSRYGSIVTTVYGLGAADGFNEAGLAGHLLFFNACNFGEAKGDKPQLHAGLWLQYLLDTSASVAEAIETLRGVDLVMAHARGTQTTVHVAIEDASGDSAIIEYVDGQMVVHQGREFVVMTNDPSYDQQLELLAQYDFSEPTSDTPLPGNVNPRDRFARAIYYSKLLPEPANTREAVAGILAVARNVSVPFGAPYQVFGIYNTEYRTAIDLTNRWYFFELTTSPNVIWMNLADLNFDEGAPVMGLDPNDIELVGDVAGAFAPLAATPF